MSGPRISHFPHFSSHFPRVSSYFPHFFPFSPRFSPHFLPISPLFSKFSPISPPFFQFFHFPKMGFSWSCSILCFIAVAPAPPTPDKSCTRAEPKGFFVGKNCLVEFAMCILLRKLQAQHYVCRRKEGLAACTERIYPVLPQNLLLDWQMP